MHLTAERLKQSGLFQEMIEEVHASALQQARQEGMQIGEIKGMQIGETKGIQIGETKGRAEELRASIRLLCEVFQIEVTSKHEAQLQTATLDELHALQRSLAQHRRWVVKG